MEVSRAALGMTQSLLRGSAKQLPKFRCSALPACQIEFLDTQATGAVFMTQKTLGYVPVSETADYETEQAAANLKCLATGGGIVADTMGLGKTFIVFLFIIQQ